MSAAPPPIVVTGGSGFVGRRVLRRLADACAERVTVVTRNPAALAERSPWRAQWNVVGADVAVDDLAESLFDGAVVMHLAAATGRVRPAVMHRANVEGTLRLLRAARAGGARAFVFVSSIAARYADRRWYEYAETKREGEAAVAAGGLPYHIIRPTMVFGPGSPVQRGLAMLSGLPVPIMFGDGEVMTQPVHVDDVAAVLCALVTKPPSQAEPVMEVGGAERLSMNALYERLRLASGRPRHSPLHVPVGPVRGILGAVEPLLRPLLPLTAGQLAAFVNDSSASRSALVSDLLPFPRGLEEMLRPEPFHG